MYILPQVPHKGRWMDGWRLQSATLPLDGAKSFEDEGKKVVKVNWRPVQGLNWLRK